MKIASFDIGIKNMAYCIFDICNNKLPEIVDWNIINLTNDETHFCSTIMKNGKNCKSKAKYEVNNQYLCEKHSKQDGYLHSLSHIKKMNKNQLIEFLNSKCICHNNNNKDYLLSKSLELCENKVLKKIVKSNANAVDLVNIGKNIKEKFENICHMNELHTVYIENQISPIASRMKTIQGMLSQYFIMKYEDINIVFCSSINKLKHLEKIFEKYDMHVDEKLEENNEENNGTKYRQHKKDAVYYCNKICEKEYKSWCHVLKTTKKDDLADCFLQGLYCIFNK